MKTKIISILALLLTVTQGAWATDPTGSVTVYQGVYHAIRVEGTATDADVPGQSITVHVYVRQGSTVITVGVLQTEASDGHFAGYVTDLAPGTYDVQVYALNNVPTDNNPSIGYQNGVTVLDNRSTQPTYNIEAVNGENGSIYLQGWAFDPDSPDWSEMAIYVFVDDIGINLPEYTYQTPLLHADVSRPDVNTARGVTGSHGFSAYIPVAPGSHKVDIYFQNDSGSGNPLAYSNYITVSSPYAVTYNANGGTGAPSAQEKRTGIDLTLSSTQPTRDGYTFAGWATSADGAVEYTAGATYTANAAVTLYAQWTCNTATSGIDWNPSTNSGTFLMPAYNVEVSTELWYLVNEEKTLDENIAAYGTKSDFFLNRTLTANVWNTFASPFAIAAADMEKYFGAGAKVRQLNTTKVESNVLTLNFTDATEIVAGQPYLVKPAANVDFSADGKEFAGVDLTAASATPTPTTYVNFIPTLGKTEVTGDVKDILMLNTSGTLVHPTATGNMKGFRGYFVMHDAPAGASEFVMNFGDGETTGIQPIRMENGTTPAEGTYDLSGRRIQGQPTQKGVYIQNGKKVVIK